MSIVRHALLVLASAALLLPAGTDAMSAPAARRGAPPAKREPARPAKPELPALASAKTALLPFDNSPFPYRGEVPEKNRPFLDVTKGERRGHASPRGGTYWEDETYSDRRVLLHLPRGFDPKKPALIVVFLHGNEARLMRDVRKRQQVPRQVAESGLNAVLVAPQFAVDALDSSAGRFWQPGAFAEFLREADEKLAELYGDERARGAFRAAPVVLAAYSGGYYPAAYILKSGRVEDRLRGVILLDALYSDLDKFSDWIVKRPPAFFVSAFGKSARDENTDLKGKLKERGVRFANALPGTLVHGSIAFINVKDEIKHDDFVTEAWVKDPLKVVLRRIPGFSRARKL